MPVQVRAELKRSAFGPISDSCRYTLPMQDGPCLCSCDQHVDCHPPPQLSTLDSRSGVNVLSRAHILGKSCVRVLGVMQRRLLAGGLRSQFTQVPTSGPPAQDVDGQHAQPPDGVHADGHDGLHSLVLDGAAGIAGGFC